MIVVDASVVVAASTEDSRYRQWAAEVLGEEVASPHGMPVEVSHALRRMERAGQLSASAAQAALEGAVAYDYELWPFLPFASRVWELRGALTAYDAWYVALAETLDVPLATLDRRLASSNGPRCRFVTPSEQ